MNLNIVIKILVKVFFFLYNYIRKVDDYMNNKGFTLVELLAVIIILSLLALLASTSVSKIVKDSKSDLYDTQINLIKSAAEAWGADNLYDLPEAGTCKYLTLHDLKQYGLIDNEIKDPRTNELFPNELLIKISGTENKFGLNNITYEINPSDIQNCSPMFTCTLISDSDKSNSITPGDKYQCKVKDDMEEGFENGYYFYVLSSEDDGTTNLIMYRNMCSDGTPTEEGKTCLVAYNSLGDAAGVGPVTAITYLNNATSTWKNIDNLNLTYDDESKNFTGFELNGKARLPYKSEVTNSNESNKYLYENLDGSNWNGNGTQPTNTISGIYGYWILSSAAGNSQSAWRVYYSGSVGGSNVDVGSSIGVRPVINVRL